MSDRDPSVEEAFAKAPIRPYDAPPLRCDECGKAADRPWECAGCATAPYCTPCAYQHAVNCDASTKRRLAAAGIEPYPRPPPMCDGCIDEAEPSWQCARCHEVFCTDCAEAHAQPPACDGKEDE